MKRSKVNILFLIILICIIIPAIIIWLNFRGVNQQIIQHSNTLNKEIKLIKTQYFNVIKLFQYYYERGLSIDEIVSNNQNESHTNDLNICGLENLEIITLTDKDDKILYVRLENEIKKVKSGLRLNREYLNNLKTNYTKNSVVVGDIVKGAISNKLTIPIAIATRDRKLDYNGAIIFGLTLPKLTDELKKDNYVLFEDILLDDCDSVVYSKIVANQFIKNLFTNDNHYYVSLNNEFIQKPVILIYNLSSVRKIIFIQILGSLIFSASLLWLVLPLLKTYYERALHTVWHKIASVYGLHLINTDLINQNIDQKFTLLINDISQKHKLSTELLNNYEYNNNILNHLVKLITNSVNDSLSIYTENVGDIVKSKPNKNLNYKDLIKIYKKALNSLYKVNMNSNSKIEALFEVINKNVNILQDRKQSVNIKSILNELGIADIDVQLNCNVAVSNHESLLKSLFSQIISYLKAVPNNLHVSIKFHDDSLAIEFITPGILDLADNSLKLELQIYSLLCGGYLASSIETKSTSMLVVLIN